MQANMNVSSGLLKLKCHVNLGHNTKDAELYEPQHPEWKS